MQVKTSYFVTYENGSAIWYAVNKEVSEEGMVSKEERPMLCAEEGKSLKRKGTNEIAKQIWLKDLSIEDFEEISDEEAEAIMEEERRAMEAEINKE